MRVFHVSAILTLLILMGSISNVAARSAVDSENNKVFDQSKAAMPHYNIAAHRVGKIGLAVTNTGTFGKGFYPASSFDCFTGDPINFGCEYPRGSGTEYMYAASLWLGSTFGRDTLVSVGADGWSYGGEMFPDAVPFGGMIKRSTLDPSSPLYNGAVSHEDYIAVYMDTFGDLSSPDYSGRSHIPLNVEITQSSYAWSYAWTEDFVLLDYQIKNIGQEALTETYIGFYVDADIYHPATDPQGFSDDLSGFLETYPIQYGNCEFMDDVNIAWSADNDGDLSGPVPAPNVTGMAPLGVPIDNPQYNFNWWVSNGNSSLDFGPRMKGTTEDPFRDFGTGGLGTPEGDANKHYIMRHPEFDYDQAYTATISPTDPIWLYPNQTIAGDIADGFDTRYLLSFGPFDIAPGQTLPITMAYVAGENFHTVPNAAVLLPDHPEQWYSYLDFSDLVMNTNWAKWYYDFPGVDTDGDGYSGKFHVCCDGGVCDTFWYEGDGVPDFGTPPGSLGDMVWVEPREEALWVRWNGLNAETDRDLFTRQIDFEGYRIYLSSDGTPGSYVEVESYDINDYLKYTFSYFNGWELRDYPMTIEELRCLYGTSCGDLGFDPLDYTEATPYIMPGFSDSVLYFEAFDLNKSQFGVNTQIIKRYPGQPYPSNLDPNQANQFELTEDGYLKYFEYELTISNLLSDECYYVNVTRTDFGAPQFGLPGDESDLYEGELSGCTEAGPPSYDYDAGWNLVSVSVELDSPTQSDVFGDDLPFWQLYGWNGSAYYNPTEVNGCGDGYWLFVPETTNVDYEGTDCAPALTTVCTETNIGWNIVGSPFFSGASLQDATFNCSSMTLSYPEAVSNGCISSQMFAWNGSGYESTDFLTAGMGCWFAVLLDGVEICWTPPLPAPRKEPKPDLFTAATENIMTISLLGTSESVQLGVNEQATAGFDSKFDMPSPPQAPGATTSLVILSDNSGIWNQFRTDVKPLEDEIIWQLKITCTENTELQIDNVSSLTQLGYSISLINNQNQIRISLGDDMTVQINPGDYSVLANRTGANTGQIPSEYVLADNYPNPFNPSTTIKFGLPVSGHVKLEIYNLLGQRVATLVDEVKQAGWHEMSWNSRSEENSAVSSGVYFYRLETGEFIQSHKMLLIK